MFFHDKRLQYNAKPAKPDPAYARKLQEVLGGKWGEITVTMQYLFQGWNCRGPAKYRDMLLSIGTEEIGPTRRRTAAMEAVTTSTRPVGRKAAAKPAAGSRRSPR